jgi:hypothetical protein
MLPYAEQFLEKAANNQWFVRFFDQANNLAEQVIKNQQLDWFAQQGLELTEVRTQSFDQPSTNFYHVNFDNGDDPRLVSYIAQFENSEGVSLQPSVYQLYEWSYHAWEQGGALQTWREFATNAQLEI